MTIWMDDYNECTLVRKETKMTDKDNTSTVLPEPVAWTSRANLHLAHNESCYHAIMTSRNSANMNVPLFSEDQMRAALARAELAEMEVDKLNSEPTCGSEAYHAVVAERDIAEAAITAAGMKPRVKPLVWEDAPEGKYISKTIIADSLIGEFSVTVSTGAAYFDGELIGLEGKETCQKNFEEVVLSTLTTEGE